LNISEAPDAMWLELQTALFSAGAAT